MTNQTTIITGATGGLGTPVVEHFIKNHSHVIALARSREKLNALKAKYNDESISVFAADLTDPEKVMETFNHINNQFDAIDVLIHIAGGISAGKTLADTDVQTWDHMMELNLKSAFLCSHAVLPMMIKQGGGKIMTIGAMAGLQPKAKKAAYGVAKAGLMYLTRAIAVEGKEHNIQANCIAPGIIDTPDNRKAMPDMDQSGWVSPDKIAKTLWYLCTENAANVTGGIIEMP